MNVINAVGAALLLAVVGSVTGRHVVLNTPPWTWDKAWVNPSKVTRAQIDMGLDVQVCKTGTWHFMPSSAETYQDFVPARIADNGKVVPINGAWVPAGIRRVMLPGQPTTVDQCRPDLLRVGTNLGAGLWGLRLDTRTKFWYGTVEGLPELITLAPFEVTP